MGRNKEARWEHPAHNVHIKHGEDTAMLSSSTGQVTCRRSTLKTANLQVVDWFWDSIWVGSEPLVQELLWSRRHGILPQNGGEPSQIL